MEDHASEADPEREPWDSMGHKTLRWYVQEGTALSKRRSAHHSRLGPLRKACGIKRERDPGGTQIKMGFSGLAAYMPRTFASTSIAARSQHLASERETSDE